MSEVNLKILTKENYLPILKLKVHESQAEFVASNAMSLAQAHFHDDSWYRGIYLGNEPIGFIMMEVSTVPLEGLDLVGQPYLWRFMIAERFQGNGYGKKALQLAIDEIKTWPNATTLFTSYQPGNGSPEKFYLSFGFLNTGIKEDGEYFMKLYLK